MYKRLSERLPDVFLKKLDVSEQRILYLKQNDKNKNNKNKNKDRNKDKQNKDQNKDQNKGKNKNDKNKNNQNKNNQQNQNNQDKMSKDNAEQLLNAAIQQEKDTKRKMQKAMSQPRRKQYEKNW
jgi:flagellar biosynthesis GTPase FlhF